MLGHDVPFTYCEKPGREVFCRNIVSCWSGKTDICSWLAENYTREQIDEAARPGVSKTESLYSLIRKAQEK